MAKNLNVSLAFTANTNEAIAAIKRLQKELNGLATGSALKDSGIAQITPEIQRAMVAAGELQAKIEAATNLKTGKLDLGQFSDSLKKGGVSLQEYANQLNALGPAGRQAFTNLAQSIIQAEAPLIRCSQRIKELGTTLANTARWQLSSSILHGFMGAVQGAYGYAQDLNASLNDIRIVTGASVAEMDAFAAKANKAARALSTTTNEYAKASLIYFQQGDSQSEAMAKAEVTAKMANVTGQSMDVVSNQLTAIWNNFNREGDVAYEHYADVLTKLGAVTASSTDEIAGGLEKFAGIADTIGLSYEYAASALATITATSRQSEDVVGTALKTIFARIQGLNLGETLEDGTSLNKYSAALQSVGISIFEASGEMKDMDTILSDMGEKWKTLSKDQQLALAQTVAGVRQYSQLVTLMDNWDFMEQNLKTANSADGSLTEQAEIYAESWEAARDEVRAAAEELYTKLLDDDFFIGFLHGIEKVIDGVSGLVDAFGGLGGVLTTIGAYVTRIFQKEMAQGLRTAAQNIKGFINPKGVQAKQDAEKQEAIQALRNMKSFAGGQEGKAENAALSREAAMQEKLYQAAKNLSAEEAKQLQIQMDSVRAMDKRAIAAAKNLDVAEKELKSLQDQNRLRAKMDAQTEARNKGRTKAGKALLEQAHKGVGQNTASFGENERQAVLAAEIKAQQAVRSKHNFSSDVSLDGYEDEIALELTKQLKSTLADLDLKEGVDKKSVQGQLDKAIREAITEATESMDIEGTGENVDKYQKQVQKAGNLNAQGIALSKLGAGGLTTEGADAKGLESVYDQLKTRIDAAKQAAKELKTEVGDSGNSSREIEQLNGVFEGLEAQLEAAKGDAEALQKILDDLAKEEGAGELISKVSQNIGADGGYIAQEANDGINQPSFNMSGQFDAATNVGLKNIQSQNSNADVKNSEEKLEESFGKSGKSTNDWADGIANATSTIMALGSAITSVQGAIDVFNDPDATGWDKVSAIISVIVGVLPVATGLFSTFGTTAATSGAAAGAGMTAALGPIGWIILAVTALIATFVLLADAAHKASPAGQFEAASKAAEEAADAASKVKAEYDALNQSLNALDSGIEAIHEMERGTLEWRAAINESNASLIDLLSTYGMLDAKNFTTNSDGLMEITDEAREALLKAQKEAVDQANNANYMAQVNKNNAASKLAASETIGDGISVMRYTSDGYAYDAATENSALSNSIGQALATALNTGALGKDGLSNSDSLTKVLESVAGLSEAEARSVADQIAASGELQSSIYELSGEIAANTEANRILNNQIVENAFGDTIDSATQGMTEAQQEQIKNMMGSDLEALTNQLYESTYKDKGFLGGGITDEDIQKQYAEAMGWATDTIDNQSGNKAKYYGKDGKEIGVISDEVARRYMAQQAAIEQMGGDVQQYVDNLQNLIQSGNQISEGVGQAMGTFAGGMGGDISNLTQEERQQLGENIGEFDEDAGTFMFGDEEITNEKAQALGYKDAKAYYDALQGALNSYDLKAENLMEGYSQSVKDSMGNMDLSKLGLDAQKKVGDALQNAYLTLGSDAMDNLSSMFENAGEDAGVLADTLSSVDWSSDNAVADLTEKLKDQGISVESLGDGWEAYIQAMLNSQDTIYNLMSRFDELRGKIASIQDIAGDMEFGDVISDEDYETLLSYNKEIADMFTMTADGWKFVGDIDDLNAKLKTSVEDVGKFKEEFATAQATGDYMMSHAAGWIDEDGNMNVGGTDYAQKTDSQKALSLYGLVDGNDNGAYDSIIEASGYSQEALQEAFANMANGVYEEGSEEYENAMAMVESFYSTAQGFMDDYANGKFEETNAEELWANSYVNTIEELNQALADGEISLETYNKVKESVLKKEADAEDIDWKEIEAYAESLQSTIPYLKDKAALAKEIALNEKKQAKGTADLTSNYKNYAKVLKSAQLDKHVKGTEEYAQTIKALKKDISLLTGVSEDVFTDDFLNSEEVQQALEDVANGVDGAAERLKVLATMQSLEIDIGIDKTQLDSLKDDIIELNNQDIEIGATINDAPALDALANLMAQSGMTVAQMQEQFNNLGWQPEIEYVEVSESDAQAMRAAGYQEYAVMNPDGSMSIESVPLNGELKQSSEQKYYIPRIKPASAGGGYTKIDPPGTGSGSNNSSGGGGGGAKKANRKSTGDKERYHTIKNQLEDLKDEYDDISEAADRAFGANKLALMDAQIEKTEELMDKQEEYVDALRDNLDTDKALMETYFTDAFGADAPKIEYDEKGNIKNFDELQDYMYADHDKKADAYENGEMSDEEWQAYEEKYALFEKQLAQYEETYDSLRAEEKAYQDLVNQKIDQRLAKVQYQAELKLNVSQDELSIIEYQLDLLDDKAFSSAERIEKSVEKAANLTDQIKITQQAMDDVLKASGVSAADIADIMNGNYTGLENKNFTESQIDAIKNYRDSLLDMNKQLIEVRNTIQDEVMAAFDEWNEKLDKGIAQFDHYNAMLESYQNIVGIVGKDVLGITDEMMADMNSAMVENSINQLESVRTKYESIVVSRDAALAKSQDMSLTEEDREFWAEQYEILNESAQEAQEELMSTWESTLEGIVAQFESSVQAAVDAFNKAIYDGGLEGLSADFEWNKDMDDMYLDDYKQIYELSKLTRDINKSMDDSKSIAGKQKLKGLIEDINKLQEEGVEMSEYDLEYLQAEYDLRLAEIALEDAQRAKDTVRLSRDSEGNFSYVYTQNTDAVDEAQQKYEDALYSMQDLSSNYIDEMSAQLIETSQEMQEELAALRVEDYASIDEYYAAVAEVEAKYQDKLSKQEAELKKAIGNNKELYEQDWANYAAATGYKISATEDFVTAWGDTSLANMMGLDDTTSFTDVIGGAADALVAGLLDAANTYYNNVDAANDAAGTSTGQFAEVLQENIDTIKTESEAAADSVELMANEMDTAMQKIIDKTADWQEDHGKKIQAIIDDNVRAAESYNGLLEYLSNNAVGDYEVLVRGTTTPQEPEAFATGGYTGEWGSSGKLALLHQKELILNQDDTANMLKLVEMTRQMIAVIDTQAQQLSQGLGTPQINTHAEERQDILEQYVEIKADFPNVSSHTEIEEAISNLINTASQYANRRK